MRHGGAELVTSLDVGPNANRNPNTQMGVRRSQWLDDCQVTHGSLHTQMPGGESCCFGFRPRPPMGGMRMAPNQEAQRPSPNATN